MRIEGPGGTGFHSYYQQQRQQILRQQKEEKEKQERGNEFEKLFEKRMKKK